VVILSSRDIWAMVPPAAAAARYREGTPWSASRRSGKPVIVGAVGVQQCLYGWE
jgi:hypothetical protein